MMRFAEMSCQISAHLGGKELHIYTIISEVVDDSDAQIISMHSLSAVCLMARFVDHLTRVL